MGGLHIYGHLRVGHHLQAFSLTPHLTVCFACGISLQGLDILLHFLANTPTHHYSPFYWLQASLMYIDLLRAPVEGFFSHGPQPRQGRRRGRPFGRRQPGPGLASALPPRSSAPNNVFVLFTSSPTCRNVIVRFDG